MEGRLTHIDTEEALRYLRCRGEEGRAAVEGDLLRCRRLLLAAARPRVVWRRFDLTADGALAGTDFRPEGQAIHAVLEGCHAAVLMAATLGAEAETLLRRAQSRSMTEAVLLDALGSAAIENVCDNLCADLKSQLAPAHFTRRFSPGYGDWPLHQQRQLFDILDVTRRIGVTLTERFLMTPQKSVTALIGLSDTPRSERGGCASCANYAHCDYRKEGEICDEP